MCKLNYYTIVYCDVRVYITLYFKYTIFTVTHALTNTVGSQKSTRFNLNLAQDMKWGKYGEVWTDAVSSVSEPFHDRNHTVCKCITILF